MTADYSAVLSRFECVRPGSRPLLWSARCPCSANHRNGDRNPSLRLWVDESTGNLKFWCARGCNHYEMHRALGTRPEDWFPPRDRNARRTPRRAKLQGEIKATYDYHDAEGNLLFQVVRMNPKAFFQRRPIPGTDPVEWAWSLSAGTYYRDEFGKWWPGVERQTGGVTLPECPRPLYRANDILQKPTEPLIVVEGEKDVDTLRWLGLLATCNPGGAGKWRWQYGSYLTGRRVAVIPDLDQPGREHACFVAATAIAWDCESVRILSDGNGYVMPPPGKDITDWLATHYHGKGKIEARKAVCDLIRRFPEYRQGVKQPQAERRAAA